MEGLRSAGRSTTPSGVSWISRSLPACRPSRSRTGLGRITRPALSILSVIPLHDGTWHWQWQAELAIRAAKVPARTCRWSCMSDTANRTAVFNFSSAIQAHTNWKLRLATNCRSASPEKIDVAALAKDDVCALGKWLHGDGRDHASHPRFRELVDAHSAFHRSAAALAALIERGKREEAAALINSRDSEFCKLSLRVVGVLMA